MMGVVSSTKESDSTRRSSGGGERGGSTAAEELEVCAGETRRDTGISSLDRSDIPVPRPDSKSSSNDECLESGGEGRAMISRGVGSSTGNGAGGFVIEMEGRFGGTFRVVFVYVVVVGVVTDS